MVMANDLALDAVGHFALRWLVKNSGRTKVEEVHLRQCLRWQYRSMEEPTFAEHAGVQSMCTVVMPFVLLALQPKVLQRIILLALCSWLRLPGSGHFHCKEDLADFAAAAHDRPWALSL
jgi:hypothetical protein